MATHIHVNDIGTAFQSQCLDENNSVIDVSQATVRQFTFVRPDKSQFTVTANLLTDGTDGYLTYLTKAGDLSQPGQYTLQVYISWGASPQWHSDIVSFQVLPNE